MDDINISQFERDVMIILNSQPNIIKISLLLEQLTKVYIYISQDDIIDRLDASINNLWKSKIVILPEMRWLSQSPKSIEGFLKNRELLESDIKISRFGRNIIEKLV